MDNKLNNMLNEFFENADAKNESEMNEKLQEFITKYNAGEIKYENTPLDDAYELLEKATNAKNEKQAIKLAKEAYKLCPDCLDAILFQVELEMDSLKREKLLNEGLEYERKRLEKENFFDKENIGSFYGMFETRPYIRGLYSKANILISEGRLKQARDICKEILKLNKNDNTGARYLLMAIFAMLEEEKELLKLYKQYSEDCLEMLYPLFAIYYKLGDYTKAKKYLKKINENNPYFIKMIDGTIDIDDDMLGMYYSIGDSSEVIMYFVKYEFLIGTMMFVDDFILANR